MIAAITLRFLDPFGTGKLVLFQVTYDKASGTKYILCTITYYSTGLARIRAHFLPLVRCLWGAFRSLFICFSTEYLFTRAFTVHTSQS